MEATQEAKQIARGGQPAWEGTFEHPVHGPLTFRVERLPTNRDWLNHAVMQEQLAPGLSGSSSGPLAAAIAGMHTFVKRPVLSETRVEDPDTPGRVLLEQILYDPLDDEDIGFPVRVWLDFFGWRAKTLSDATMEQVKNSSGATSGDATVGSSPVTTD